jgi:HEPN domain-containing protein
MLETQMYLSETTRMATEYYASARVAVASGMHTICGNLFHHAFELMIKAALMNRIDINSVRPPYKHDLPRLWIDFKVHYTVPDTQFDPIPPVLHAFEDLRYPDQYVNDHNQISIVGMGLSGTSVKFGFSPGVRIVLNVDQLAKWWQFLHTSTGFNPDYAVQAIRSPAREYLVSK